VTIDIQLQHDESSSPCSIQSAIESTNRKAADIQTTYRIATSKSHAMAGVTADRSERLDQERSDHGTISQGSTTRKAETNQRLSLSNDGVYSNDQTSITPKAASID
jgi:hypothetical protein